MKKYSAGNRLFHYLKYFLYDNKPNKDPIDQYRYNQCACLVVLKSYIHSKQINLESHSNKDNKDIHDVRNHVT